MSLYLAFDVGGTKTAAVLADGERTLARAEAGSIKTLRVLPGEAALHLRAVLSELEAQSGMRLRGAVERTCVGTSGVSAPAVRDWMREAFSEAVGGELLLLGDEVIALDAAFAGGRGVLVIAGTGSNIVGRAVTDGDTGEMVHTGGWGPALADEGSGHWIGTEALRACFRTIDDAAPSAADKVSADGERIAIPPGHLPPLLGRALEALGLPTLDDLIGAANAPGFRSAALVPVVVSAARDGDALARELLLRAGRDLAALAGAVVRKLELLEAQTSRKFEVPEVAFVGGVLANIGEVHGAMAETLGKRYPGIVVQQRPVDPLAGALWYARGRPRFDRSSES